MNNDNKDLVNDILKELENDSKKEAAPVEPEPVQEQAPVRHEAQPAQHERQPEQAPAASPEQIVRQTMENGAPQQRPVNNSSQMRGPAQGQQVRKRKRHKKKQRSRLPGVLILTTFIFGLSIVLSMVIIGYGKDMLGIGKSDRTQLMVIPEGATTDDIANMLETEGIIRSPKAFKLFSRLRKADGLYIPGEHFVRPNMAYETIIKELTSEQVEEQGETVEVTFPEGITLIDAAQKLEENNICSADDFLFYFNSGGYGFEFEDKLPLNSSLKFMRMEGYLFPDTYFLYEGMDPEQVCQKIYLNFDSKMTEDRYKRMDELGYSLDQIITLASIVQKEAATEDVMVKVASVFWNRLDNWDPALLQSDPTSNYANDVIKPNMEVLDLTIANSYDTYLTGGLPPGAICNPGIAAIDAVLEKFESDDFFFAANINTKITYFAKTDEEHEANLAMIDQQYADEAAAAEAAENGESW